MVAVGKPRGALQTTVLVEDDAFADQRDPREEVGKPSVAIAIFGKVHHGRAPLQTDR